jgi:PAS domain S-box-containing protein
MIGIPGSEMVGKTMFELFPAELAAKITADDWRVVSEGKLLNLEEELNGRIYSSIKFPILQGDKYLLAGYSMDVTVERQSEKALRESEEKQRLSSIYSRSLIEASIDPLVTINADGKITDVNSATENATGISRKDMIGTDFSDYFTEPDKAKIVYQEVFEQGKVVDYPITIRHSSNKLIDVLYNASVYHNDQGNILGVFASARDITVVKKIQEEIKLKNEELEKLNAEKDKFFSIISHDLRSPFQALLGFSSMNPDELLSLPLEKIQKIALAMRTSADKLYNLLDNLLEWSQLQRGTISFKPYRIRLGEVIKEIVTIIRDAADKKMIVINWDIPADLTVMADEKMFESLMRNLVFNAVKFTHKGGSITISAKQVEGNQVRISVKDNGIGMNQQMIDDIFTLDVKTTRPGTEGEPSTGLGLILCKEFIEKHGGKIWVESEEGKGSTFSFSLPARQE